MIQTRDSESYEGKRAYQNKNRELRMVVTQSCNYNCYFCHGEGLQTKQKDNFTPEDYGFLYLVGKKYFGFEKTTLSGGEPLFRKDIVKIAKELKKEGANITVTTNGVLLSQRKGLGKYIDRFNISLHSLDKEKYEGIVGRKNMLEKVLEGIDIIKEENPGVEIRLNAALVDKVNDSEDDIRKYLAFAQKSGASIKYMGLYPGTGEGFVPFNNLESILKQEGFNKIDSNGRSSTYIKDDQKVILSKIFCSSAEENDAPGEFCHKYNDMFVTPEGKLKPCRVSLKEIDILKEVKSKNEEGLRKKIEEAFAILGSECPLKSIGE